jgi:error-prone DNA polymerase
MVAGLATAAALRIVLARAEAPFTHTEDLALRAALDQGDLKALAGADALRSLSGHRRQQVWDASALRPRAGPCCADRTGRGGAGLPPAPGRARRSCSTTPPPASRCAATRSACCAASSRAMKLRTAAELRDLPHGRLVRACGIVVMRQQPQTAKGVVFVTLEDETGSVNVIVWKSLREKQAQRRCCNARLLAVQGTWQRDVESGGEVRHLIATTLVDLTPLLGGLATRSREFHFQTSN